ncbi:hypothetical protein PSEUBRA_000926 [Kalmanozyma brasiliensis GHG001]|uniref:Uncharacterized protein n=1 Tax=Kalmanozyma brasiliensis (strain GHG001) TaxID=1365824 RepID=V5EZI7_KALBG|nr:uncharacterized protein PSEUBRA_000926 [Kalmanozyma brasiliensis GHG001]EST09333.1 hypothetical protein PSEUBRA_000926 [Kalmanozyma brasiliensis GHG001]
MSRQGARWFAPSAIPPILLLTVVTSFAFNHALITTQRRQDVRTHRIRSELLRDTIDYNSRLLYQLNPPSTSRTWFGTSSSSKDVEEKDPEWVQEERLALLRRWKALGSDPVAQGLLPSDGPSATTGSIEQSRTVGPKEVTWSEIFLGNRETRSSLAERFRKVTAGIKESFDQLTPTSTPSSREKEEQTSAAEEKELAELSQLWSTASKES